MAQPYASLGAALARPHQAPALRAQRLLATIDLAIAADCDDHVEHLQRQLDQLDADLTPAPILLAA